MFEQSLVESTQLLRTHNRWATLTSFMVQALLATAVVTVPLLHPAAVAIHLPPMSLTAPALPPRPAPPPPPERVHIAPSTSSAPSAPAAHTATPTPTHPTILDPNRFGDDAPSTSSVVMTGPGAPSDLVSSLSSSTPSSARVAVATAPKPGPPTRISEGVSAGLLLAPIRPVYPQIAIISHQEGTVVVHALISKAGTIESANVVSGPIMLQSAALEAVRSARYRPFRLNGEPTAVDTTFSIIFHLRN